MENTKMDMYTIWKFIVIKTMLVAFRLISLIQ